MYARLTAAEARVLSDVVQQDQRDNLFQVFETINAAVQDGEYTVTVPFESLNETTRTFLIDEYGYSVQVSYSRELGGGRVWLVSW